MRACLCLALLLACVSSGASAAERWRPVIAAPEGQRAFRDLARMYENRDAVPPFNKALTDLTDASGEKRKAAGGYLLALLRQSMADEANGRAEWKRQIYWGGGAESEARNFRRQLAKAFGEKATGNESLDAALWLIDEDRV